VEQTTQIQKRKTRFFVGILGILFAFLSLASWGISSPMGSSPDDNFHLASVWCGNGVREGICEETNDLQVLSIPKLVYESPGCLAYKAENSASCQSLDLAASGYARSDVFDFNNSDHLYPPAFYATASLFVTQDPVASIWSVRLANAAIAVLLYTLLFLMLPKSMRHLPIWTLTLTTVPLGMFIIPSNNPSSWAITGAGLLLFSVIGYYQTTGKQRLGLAALAITGSVMMAGARADAAIYAGIALVAGMIISAKKSDLRIVKLWLPFTITVIAISFFLTANQVELASGGLDGAADPTLTTATLIFRNLVMMPLLWVGIFGTWGLGWLDTPMPETTWIASTGAFVVLAVLGINRLAKRTWIAGILVLAALWFIPTYILVKSHATVGVLVQPRYMLPLIVALTGIALYRVAGIKAGVAPKILGLLALFGLSIANALALHRNLKRYVTGIDISGWNLDARAEWWWNIPVSPMGLWAIGSLAFIGFIAALYYLNPITGYGVSRTDRSIKSI
jgi:hypothetical protein